MASPALITGAWPTTVTRSRWPRALTRRTQKPLSGLWNVTRSTRPVSASEPAACRPGLVSAPPWRLGAFLRISRLAMHLVANDARRHLCEVSHQGLVERLELRPENVTQEALGGSEHARRPALTLIAIRPQAVAPGKRKEKLPGPRVTDAEPQLDGRGRPPRLRETGLDPRERRFRRPPLAGRGGAGKQGLDLAQPCTQLLLGRHAARVPPGDFGSPSASRRCRPVQPARGRLRRQR